MGGGGGGGMNGGGGGGGMAAASRPWPNVGEQMDMNVLWELVNNLAEVHQGIREQTAGVLQRVQMIQTRVGESHGMGNGNGGEGAVGEVEKTNGDGVAGENGHGKPPRSMDTVTAPR
jgi:hypothetical protein